MENTCFSDYILIMPPKTLQINRLTARQGGLLIIWFTSLISRVENPYVVGREVLWLSLLVLARSQSLRESASCWSRAQGRHQATF